MNIGPSVRLCARSLLVVFFFRRRRASAAWALFSAVLLSGFVPGRVGAVEVPSVSADLGPCTVDFTVADGAKKPLYNAKIHVRIKYGFLGLRRMSLEVGTNSDGKARIEGLPSKVRKEPLGFVVRYGNQVKTIEHYPAVKCNAHYTVVMEGNQATCLPCQGGSPYAAASGFRINVVRALAPLCGGPPGSPGARARFELR